MMNEKAGFNSKVVLVQPIANHGGFNTADVINEQDGLYTLYLRGFENGQKVNDKRIISCVSRCLNVHSDYEAVMACAENPDLRYITCNTTEAGIAYNPPASLQKHHLPAILQNRLSFYTADFKTFGKEAGKGFVILIANSLTTTEKSWKNAC